MAIPNSLVPCRDGDWLMIVVPSYWGKGSTIAEAKKALAEVAGSRSLQSKHWVVYSVDKGATLDDVFGQIHHEKDRPPLKIAQEGITD